MTKRSFILSACAIAALTVFGCNESKDWNPAPKCGNGVVELGEACEPGVAVNVACSYFDASTKWVSGRPECSDNCRLTKGNCTGEAPASVCGNGVVEANEECDGTIPEGVTCESRMSGSTGTLTCTADCKFNTSGCTVPANCGNGTIDEGEQCDGEAVDPNFTMNCGEGMKAADTLVCVADTCMVDITQSCVVDGVKCDTDEECAEVDGKTKCDEEKGICVEPPVVCSSDEDCAEVDGKPKCDEEKLICVAEAVVEVPCETDDDCADVVGKTKCDEEKLVCVEGPCTDGAIKCAPLAGIEGYIAYTTCVDGVWEEGETNCGDGLICSCGDGEGATCSSVEEACIVNPNPDCAEGDIKCVDESTYQVCSAAYGFWSTGIGRCGENSDDEGTYCDANQNKCVEAPEPECTTNDDCTDPAKPVCDDGVCVAGSSPECTTNDDCTDPAKPVCDDGVCVAGSSPECTTNDDCTDPA
ncbi:MAG: hypothetical protein J6A01_06580, partial [Proteobacteria bacterium]|nr:hypothetical protein [Pseudomonadota bacterium]